MAVSVKAIVIGSGVAGLASAIRLSLSGFEVTVLEKNGYPGGKLSSFSSAGYHFDAGPSLFTQPENIKELFDLAGEPMEAYFQYSAMQNACKYFYEDGTVLTAAADAKKLAITLHEAFGEQISNVETYLQQSKTLYENVGTIFLNYSLHRKDTLTKAPVLAALTSVKSKHLFSTLHKVNKTAFKDERTVQLFNRYATYNGSNPYQAPGMLSLIPHLEYNQGVFYPKGGMISITNALYKLAKKLHVTFVFDAPVKKITLHNNRATGVETDRETYQAPLVVSNMDVYGTYKYLLQQEQKAAQILKQERSSSALVFYWGIKTSFPQLELHNIFFSKNYKEEFDHLFIHKRVYEDPTVYINITSKCEPGIQAPVNKENWFVMVNAPANVGQDWGKYRALYRAAIIQKLNRLLHTNVEPLIEAEEILDPVLIEEKTASYMGSLYGTSSNSRMAAFLRHPNFSKKIKGLYFAGGSVHPGGGIPLCLKSAKIMCDMVQQDYRFA
ncbi:phytoene desaturase [Panacibacter sp. DH6]|uniref:Phytoene desaturase n=1 Tax=Panacibacter microcysteis TaxID=2793269 RepID=A0A931E3V7_9BACT|nr:1-hydroxycarotenoid 3,4-desaturase CrtD [Panacibacter microcysteis]MBG9375647.1 phytoene desaturase [Panacibacter microcysteis]